MADDLAGTPVSAFSIDLAVLEVTPSLVATAMGYPDGVTPEPYAAMSRRAIEEAPGHADIRAGFRVFPPGSLSLERSGFRLEGRWFGAERIITAGLEGSTGLAVFAATVGRPFDDWIREHFDRNDLVGGFVIDSLGSVIAEAAADWIERRIIGAASDRGLWCTNRFSPGYCGWPVDEQHDLFSFLPAGFCGIALTPTALMVPMKSVSGVIGVGSDVERKEYACRICDDEDCFRRRAESVK